MTGSASRHSRCLSFWKMEGCGNHFIVCSPESSISESEARQLCEPHFGIGADGVMVITRQQNGILDVAMRNPDGSPMGMCGNGIRCVALYVREHNILTGTQYTFQVEGRLIRCVVNGSDVDVDMGEPILDANRIPLYNSLNPKNFTIQIGNRQFQCVAVSMGNPHCIIFVENLPGAEELAYYGSAIENHSYFPQRTNVEFVRVVDKTNIHIAVWERGAGATLACGTAACATVVAGVQLGVLERIVRVQLPGGSVKVCWKSDDNSVILSGYARKVFEGEICYETHSERI